MPDNLEDPTVPLSDTELSKRGPAQDLDADQPNDFTRYSNFRVLGKGGAGQVHAVWDPQLCRQVALKQLHEDLADSAEQRLRFIREARVMARIEHPNVLPVHEIGHVEEDGPVYFTMKKVDGQTLSDVLAGLRQGEATAHAQYPMMRLIDIFLDVCQGIAFAHSRRILHRDLKPSNIAIGSFGEVLILDWGLAKLMQYEGGDGMGDPSPSMMPLMQAELGETSAAASGLDVELTTNGQVSGTPRYMAPEQALGQLDMVDERTDVYSLGAVFYELLTLKPSVADNDIRQLLMRVIEGDVVPPRQRAPERDIAPELDAICRKAMAVDMVDRYPSVQAMIADIDAWREGLPVSVYHAPLHARVGKWIRRHPVKSSAAAAMLVGCMLVLAIVGSYSYARSSAVIREAEEYHTSGDRTYAQLTEVSRELMNAEAARVLKTPSEREETLAHQVRLLEDRMRTDYELALTLYAEADRMMLGKRRRDALRQIYRKRLEYALSRKDWHEIRQIMDFIEGRIGPEYSGLSEADRQDLAGLLQMLDGTAILQVSSSPSGASFRILPLLDDESGQLLPDGGNVLQLQDGDRRELPAGRYLLEASVPGRPPVQVALRLERGGGEKLHVGIPSQVPAGTVFVPGGAFYMGGELARNYRLHRRHLGGFFIGEKEVTWSDYLAYWRATRDSPSHDADMSRIRLSRDERRFLDAWDENGRLRPELDPERPVVGITQAAAARYCAWLGEQIGRPVLLPSEEQWEKAARSADGREYPWGLRFRDDFAMTLENDAGHAAYGSWAPPGALHTDRSVYGAYDMAGNVREWTRSLYPDGSYHVIKGGSASTPSRFAVASYSSDTPVVPSDVGFRILIPLDRDRDGLAD